MEFRVTWTVIQLGPKGFSGGLLSIDWISGAGREVRTGVNRALWLNGVERAQWLNVHSA